MTVNSDLTASVVYYDSRDTKSSKSTKTATSTGPSVGAGLVGGWHDTAVQDRDGGDAAGRE